MSLAPPLRAVVIDNGTGYTKAGYSGNTTPDYVFPTAIAAADEGASDIAAGGREGIRDLDFSVGHDALANTRLSTTYPIRHGVVENWTAMERLWQRCFFDYLRCDPEEHHVVLTEPPLNPPENREYAAEIMFETFNVPGLYIGVQAVLALAAAFTQVAPGERTLTGTVIDSGDGVTHVIPVAEGYVIGGAIKHIPLAGRDITAFVQQSLRERGEPVPPQDSLDVARRIKEGHCYVGQDIVREFQRFDANPGKHFAKASFTNPRTRSSYSVDVGYEQFLAPELFFNPEIYSPDFTKPLPEVVDEAILQSPIDTRRGLYGRVVLSGGSTMFRNFHKRLQQDLKERVDRRLAANVARLGARHQTSAAPQEMKVKVISHEFQRYAVWFGGSMAAYQDGFRRHVITKARYQEEGPRCARSSSTFNFTSG